MKASKLVLHAVLALSFAASVPAGEEVARLLDEYARIETVTCQIRRTKEGGLGKMTFLSRVYWTNKNKLHSEGISPLKRRTIVDGKKLWQYVQGDPKGFSRPVEDLSDQMTISLKMMPGTAMDHLLRLRDLEEVALTGEAGEKKVGIHAEERYVVLAFDDMNRLAGLDFYKTEAMKEKLASYSYRNFMEAASGVWIPLTHEVTLNKDESEFHETIKVDRFVANEPIAESLFIASSFFDESIDFVDEFAKIFPE